MVIAEDDRAPFCRFAIGNDRGSEQMFVTPLTSKLLAKEDQWKPRKFLSTHLPAVLDLSPDVLGPSEGFSKAHCQIHAAVGFAEDRHLTWKVRSIPSCLRTDAQTCRSATLRVKSSTVSMRRFSQRIPKAAWRSCLRFHRLRPGSQLLPHDMPTSASKRPTPLWQLWKNS